MYLFFIDEKILYNIQRIQWNTFMKSDWIGENSKAQIKQLFSFAQIGIFFHRPPGVTGIMKPLACLANKKQFCMCVNAHMRMRTCMCVCVVVCEPCSAGSPYEAQLFPDDIKAWSKPQRENKTQQNPKCRELWQPSNSVSCVWLTWLVLPLNNDWLMSVVRTPADQDHSGCKKTSDSPLL